jgi:hypothetical protein
MRQENLDPLLFISFGMKQSQDGWQEIVPFLYDFLKRLPDNDSEDNMYSDFCSRQNRNILVAVMLLTAVNELKENGKVITINHKFLEDGHSHLEADNSSSSLRSRQFKQL